MTEALGTFVAPAVRGHTMRIHPVIILFATLAGALAFGLIGALAACPRRPSSALLPRILSSRRSRDEITRVA